MNNLSVFWKSLWSFVWFLVSSLFLMHAHSTTQTFFGVHIWSVCLSAWALLATAVIHLHWVWALGSGVESMIVRYTERNRDRKEHLSSQQKGKQRGRSFIPTGHQTEARRSSIWWSPPQMATLARTELLCSHMLLLVLSPEPPSKTFSKMLVANGQYMHATMLNITRHQENTNQNHYGVSTCCQTTLQTGWRYCSKTPKLSPPIWCTQIQPPILRC